MVEVVRVVSLWIRPGQESAFDAFERDASKIMAEHGGRIDRAIRIRPKGGKPPYEVHVVVFPNESAFESYRSDPKTQQLALRRAQIIGRTLTLTGDFVGPY